jgi:hypothetical protein
MAIQRATDEANIRQRINRLVEALRAMDLEGVMSLYAPDIGRSTSFRRCSTWEQRQKRKTGWTPLRCTSVRSVRRFATSRSPWAMTWHSGTASIE